MICVIVTVESPIDVLLSLSLSLLLLHRAWSLIRALE